MVEPRPQASAEATGRSEKDTIVVIGAVMTVLLCGIGALIVLVSRPPAGAQSVLLPGPMQYAQQVRQQTPQPQAAQAAVVPAPRPTAAAVAPMGNWTAQIGVEIARRGLQWVGWPYSFGAGGTYGPSFGHAVDTDSRRDGSVYGFDCSGLTMYALAPWRSLTHFAATQYGQVGSFHPRLDQLQPGDLIFWSPNDTIASIAHVAIYVGNGEVVQAPHSGARITVTPMYSVESGYIGATRPLT